MTTLGLKLSRRLVALVVVTNGVVEYSSLHVLPLDVERARVRLVDHLEPLADRFELSEFSLYAPTPPQSLAGKLVGTIAGFGARRGIPVQRRSAIDLLSGFSVVPVRTREQLRRVIETMWADAAFKPGYSKAGSLALSDAAAAAFLGQIESQLPPL